MGNKLLHERLREWASNRPFRFNEAWEEFEVAGNDELLAAFADEIERQYVPVPRFPDGEPVHLGCPVCGGVVGGFSVWDDGSFALYSEDGDVLQEGEPGDFSKRPELKALDADGIEINVGDVVWSINNGCEHEVIGLPKGGCYQSVEIRNVITGSKGGIDAPLLTHTKPVFDADGERICVGDTVWPIDAADMKMIVDNFQDIYGLDTTVNCTFEGEMFNFNPEKLTHKEPDSLEKLRASIKAVATVACGASKGEVKEWADRLTALMERGA